MTCLAKRLVGADFRNHRLDRWRQYRLLGAAGRSGSAHIMQFRPVGIEGPGKELPPEAADRGIRLVLSVTAGRRGGNGRGNDACQDTCHDVAPLFRARLLPPRCACFDAGNEFSPDLLKEGFNCRDPGHTRPCLGPHGDGPVMIRGERSENEAPRLPFGGRAATSAGSKFP